MKKKQLRRAGDFVKIALGDGRWAFGRVLNAPLIGFYEVISSKILSVDELKTKPIAFKIWVMKYAITHGDWPVIGHSPLTPELEVKPPFFKQDAISGELSLTFDGGEDEVPATIEECKPLERAAVWEPEHVVQRLKDHFAGRPNVWVERLRLNAD